jgi:hypothetical protein
MHGRDVSRHADAEWQQLAAETLEVPPIKYLPEQPRDFSAQHPPLLDRQPESLVEPDDSPDVEQSGLTEGGLHLPEVEDVVRLKQLASPVPNAEHICRVEFAMHLERQREFVLLSSDEPGERGAHKRPEEGRQENHHDVTCSAIPPRWTRPPSSPG